MADEIAFEIVKDQPVPEKQDPDDAKLRDQITRNLRKQELTGEIKNETGYQEPQKKGMLTKDTPKAIFRLCAGFIDCPRFNLSDEEAEIYARSLNILFPIEGKLIAVCNILLITVGKILLCIDAIKAKFGKKEQPPGETEKPDNTIVQSRMKPGGDFAHQKRTKEENDELFGKPME